MTRQSHISKMSERQKKSFIAMYNSLEYSTADIAQRFGMSTATVTATAHELKLNIRQGKR